MSRRIAVALLVLSFLLAHLSPRATSEEHPKSSAPFLEKTPIQAISVTPNGHIYAGTFGGGVFMSIDQGETWTDRNAGLTDRDVFALVANTRGTIFAGTFGGGVYRNDGNISGWVQSNTGLDCTEIVSLEIAPDGSLYAGTSSHGVYCSLDNGETWVATGLNGCYVATITANSNNDILAGTKDGIFLSTNHGKNWRAVNNGLTCLDVWEITGHPSRNLFAATNGGGVYRSQDNGVTWAQMNNGLTNKSAGSLAVCLHEQLFVGTTSGVFCSTNNAATWAKVQGSLTDDAIRCLRMGGNGSVIAGTLKGNIYRSSSVAPIPENLGEVFAPVALSDGQ